MIAALGWTKVAGTFLIELAKATLDTIKAVLGAQERLKPAILAVPLDVRSPEGITLLANMISLTPGTTSLDVSADCRTLYVHALHSPDTEATITGIKATLERRAQEVLP
ncbi:Na+/H+ antiporter subunit E [Arenibaculum pallidiluteum]|uniref:Na+/H+ antiporter subunit E n=1 Tax=Arenibaculum pallidiluteum TaxID=2812559 RepID=UPI001A971F19|nr:Na+/H+ antiporter subunit E [Arenibaculum pallidiluteum]